MCFDRLFVQIFRAVCKKSWEISVNFVVLSLVSPALYHAKSEKARAASVKLQKDAGEKSSPIKRTRSLNKRCRKERIFGKYPKRDAFTGRKLSKRIVFVKALFSREKRVMIITENRHILAGYIRRTGCVFFGKTGRCCV
jgi:hypothetical protein